jgi:ATP-dependent Clp protease ATP-binding subunit ClpA
VLIGRGLIDRGNTMKISESLNQIIMAAYAEANTRSHEFVTPEHLLYAALFFDDGSDIIQRCGGDPEHLKRVLAKHLRDGNPVVEGAQSVQSLGFQNVLERAVWHTTSAQKDIVELGDVLVSILDEKGSYASFFLKKEGITRLSLLNYISHGVSVIPETSEVQKRGRKSKIRY